VKSLTYPSTYEGVGGWYFDLGDYLLGVAPRSGSSSAREEFRGHHVLQGKEAQADGRKIVGVVRDPYDRAASAYVRYAGKTYGQDSSMTEAIKRNWNNAHFAPCTQVLNIAHEWMRFEDYTEMLSVWKNKSEEIRKPTLNVVWPAWFEEYYKGDFEARQ
jgi:hypothetical protein